MNNSGSSPPSTGTTCLRSLLRKQKKAESPLDPDAQLRGLSDAGLTPALPDFAWPDAAGALDEELRPWLDTVNPVKPAVFYVAPPYAGREEILLAWARETDATVVEPPDQETVLSGNNNWLQSWPKSGAWVFPCLEKCFLRQASGLDFVRHLLSSMLSGELGQGIVGCDSWAWEFLRHVWPGRPSYTLSAQSFDGERLQHLFSTSITNTDSLPGRFRSSTDGSDILPQAGSDENRPVDSGFWKALAATSRGNPGVASAYWRKLLRTVREPDSDGEPHTSEASSRNTVWVQPLEALQAPSVPADAGQTSHFVLHALLVHAGLSTDRLAELLPGDRTTIIEALLFLREAGIVEMRDTEWRVTAWLLLVVDQRIVPLLARQLPGRFRVHVYALIPTVRLVVLVAAGIMVVRRIIEPTAENTIANFWVHPDHDGATVRRRLKDVALTSPFTQLRYEPAVVCQETPWGSHYRIRAYPIDPDQQFLYITDLTERGRDTLKALGVSMQTTPPVASPTAPSPGIAPLPTG